MSWCGSALPRRPAPASHGHAGQRNSVSGCFKHRPAPRAVAARGILDSYRKSKGLQTSAEEGGAATPSTSGISSSTGAATLPKPPAPSSTSQPASHLEQLLDLDDGDIAGGSVHFTEDDTPCPIDCVLELAEAKEMHDMLDNAPPTTLVVVDYYKTSCGACKYIATGFTRLCKATQQDNPAVLFAKHNVFDDEAEEVTDLARELNIRNVPLFVFYKAGQEVERFATRDKERVAEAIGRLSSLSQALIEESLAVPLDD